MIDADAAKAVMDVAGAIDKAVVLRKAGFVHIGPVGPPPHNCWGDLMSAMREVPESAMPLPRGTVWRCAKCGKEYRRGWTFCDWEYPYDFFGVRWYRLRWWHRRRHA